MSSRLVVDLDKCRDCDECTAACTYPYHGDNNGIARLREVAAFEITCRRCDARLCVEACPTEALQEREGGVLKRHNMRCTGCLSCALACPFGNVIPAALQFRDMACDFCAGRDGGSPECVSSCPLEALTVEDVSDEGENVHVLSDDLAVRAKAWQKIEVAQAQ